MKLTIILFLRAALNVIIINNTSFILFGIFPFLCYYHCNQTLLSPLPYATAYSTQQQRFHLQNSGATLKAEAAAGGGKGDATQKAPGAGATPTAAAPAAAIEGAPAGGDEEAAPAAPPTPAAPPAPTEPPTTTPAPVGYTGVTAGEDGDYGGA